jgi:hypothetical protein
MGITDRRISPHLEEHSHSGSIGCNAQPLIQKTIFEDCVKRRRNLNIVQIGYYKAFDSVPYSWIENSIELMGMNNKVVIFCKLSMKKWSTQHQLKTKKGLM